jgi:hypothetical protein
MSDPAEWMDDYYRQWQYDDDLIAAANLELTVREDE